MNFSQLESLIAITETGNFSDAADRVGLTRSALSHAISNLEAELGVTLIKRKRDGAVPTTIGNCVLKNAREILASVEGIRQEAALVRGLETGKLRIGIVSSITSTIWRGILHKFQHEYSGIEIVTMEGTGHEVEDWILSSIVDVGFVLRQADGIDTTIIGQDEVLVLAPANHPLRKQKSVSIDHIAHEPFILPKIACDFLDASWHGEERIQLQRQYEVTELQTILTMVLEGFGITMLPEMLLPARIEGLHTLSLDPPLCFSFGVGVSSTRKISPAAQKFVQSSQAWAQSNGFDKVSLPS